MIIRLDRLGDEPFLWRETIEITPDELDSPDLVTLSPISCQGRVREVSPGFLFQANLGYEQTLACMRCLQATVLPTDIEIELLLMIDQPRHGADQKLERQLDAEELSVIHLPSPAFDPTPLVHEQVQLNIPMKPICRPDCAGLCSACGADLNAGSCACGPPVDPRWGALAAFKNRSSE